MNLDEDLPLARRECCHALLNLREFGPCLPVGPISLEARSDRSQQILIVGGFGQEVHRPPLHGLHAHWDGSAEQASHLA
jgi:hypothetical protein